MTFLFLLSPLNLFHCYCHILLYSKTPKQVFFNPINIFDSFYTLYLLFYNILFSFNVKIRFFTVKWIQPTAGAQAQLMAAKHQTMTAIALCTSNEPVQGITLINLNRHPSRPSAEATFTFNVPSLENIPFVLCYRFGSEPYQIYPTMTMTSITPNINYVNRDMMVEGLTNIILFGGTTGVTHGDAAKWIPQGRNCTTESGHGGVGLNGASAVPVTPSLSTGTAYGDLLEGSFNFKTGPVSWSHPWQLCYRFGNNQSPFLPYLFYMRIKTIHNVSILTVSKYKSVGERASRIWKAL